MFNFFSKKNNEMADFVLIFKKIRNVIENYCYRENVKINDKKELSCFAFCIWVFFLGKRFENDKNKYNLIYAVCEDYLCSKMLLSQEEILVAIANYTIDIGNVYYELIPEFDHTCHRKTNWGKANLECYKLGKSFIKKVDKSSYNETTCIKLASHSIGGGYAMFFNK
ncbi:hypothetical protein J5048_004279 [Salmonella enterica]|nr:hypothetical protein [Salmonella enterica subsp. enterica serovar Edinburgh]EBH8903964.1 hypothetical protein [Salmonella enterica subsp. enterica serovar 6,7:b:-]EBH8908107.1 hypothetical protein [Salmonella enterica subsp. enterica serovar Santiago]EHG2694873.1 hypothetical protein [Salmonella enterica]EBH8944688.1 hypothetical protein [Salmonella enterica subsp. enterica serovar 6,7:b:-]